SDQRPTTSSQKPESHSPLASDALVDKPELLHLLRIEQISAVEEDGVSEATACAFEVEFLEHRPFGGDDQSIAALGHVVHVVDVGDILEEVLGLFHGLGIMDAEDRALLKQAL